MHSVIVDSFDQREKIGSPDGLELQNTAENLHRKHAVAFMDPQDDRSVDRQYKMHSNHDHIITGIPMLHSLMESLLMMTVAIAVELSRNYED